MIHLLLLATVLAQVAAQPARTQPQVTAPADVKPGSINLDDVEYPYRAPAGGTSMYAIRTSCP